MLPPSYQKSNPTDSPILFYTLTSDLLPLSSLDEYAQTYLAQRISTIKDITQMNVFGSQKYAMRIQLDPQTMTAHGINIDQMTKTIASKNINLPNDVL